jgi:hypothetical protein
MIALALDGLYKVKVLSASHSAQHDIASFNVRRIYRLDGALP